MNKFVLFLLIILASLSIYAQQVPIMKIYMDDGSIKQYKIEEIANMKFIYSNLSFVMSVFQKHYTVIDDIYIK